MIGDLIIALIILAPVCLVTISIIGDIGKYRAIQRRLMEERQRRRKETDD